MEDSAPTKRGIILYWKNMRNGRIVLLRNNYTFPFSNIRHLFVIWNCGDISINVPPYKNILSCDVKNINGGPHKFSMMRNLMKNMHRG